MLQTPMVMVDVDKLRANIQDMADFAQKYNLSLRPHIKAHKTIEIARMQMEAGAVGVTVAKLSEAEVMFGEGGIDDILVAYPLVTVANINRAARLMEAGCRLTLMVDSVRGAELLAHLPARVEVVVKVDVGLNRCGFVPDEKLYQFIRWLVRQKNIAFKGIMTHAGHAYGCTEPGCVEEIGLEEGNLMAAIAATLEAEGIPIDTVSIGSTPTVKHGGKIAGVTEIRPGNYVFYDATQVALGVVEPERCSLRVLTTVVSKPSSTRIIIDAGAKTLALDRGAHGSGLLTGFGIIPGHPEWTVTRLSEEHGVIEGDNLPEVGSCLEVIPNHACPVVNLTDKIWLTEGSSWQVRARGRVW